MDVAVTMENTKTKGPLFGEDYNHHFSPSEFLDGYWKDIHTAGMQFILENTYSHMQKVPSSASRFLDLGCGPSLAGVLPAPDYFDHIVMADFTEANRDMIKRFLCGEDVDFDWNHVCQHYIKKYGLKSDWGIQRLTLLKHYIKEIRFCDVLRSDPLGPVYREYFDCVLSSFCLEVASRDFETYCRSVRNVSSLIKDGGYLILRCVIGQSTYPINDKEFYTLPLTWEQLMKSQQEAGFRVIENSSHPIGDSGSGEKVKGQFVCLRSQKIL